MSSSLYSQFHIPPYCSTPLLPPTDLDLPLTEAMQYWRDVLVLPSKRKKMDKYMYMVRHNYGKAGSVSIMRFNMYFALLRAFVFLITLSQNCYRILPVSPLSLSLIVQCKEYHSSRCETLQEVSSDGSHGCPFVKMKVRCTKSIIHKPMMY
jgi:hypothetical protein